MGPQNLCDAAQIEGFSKIVGEAWRKQEAERRADGTGGGEIGVLVKKRTRKGFLTTDGHGFTRIYRRKRSERRGKKMKAKTFLTQRRGETQRSKARGGHGFMAAHFAWLDAIAARDKEEIDRTSEEIGRWDKYGG
jgi:hypothetical protein